MCRVRVKDKPQGSIVGSLTLHFYQKLFPKLEPVTYTNKTEEANELVKSSKQEMIWKLNFLYGFGQSSPHRLAYRVKPRGHIFTSDQSHTIQILCSLMLAPAAISIHGIRVTPISILCSSTLSPHILVSMLQFIFLNLLNLWLGLDVQGMLRSPTSEQE